MGLCAHGRRSQVQYIPKYVNLPSFPHNHCGISWSRHTHNSVTNFRIPHHFLLNNLILSVLIVTRLTGKKDSLTHCLNAHKCYPGSQSSGMEPFGATSLLLTVFSGCITGKCLRSLRTDSQISEHFPMCSTFFLCQDSTFSL